MLRAIAVRRWVVVGNFALTCSAWLVADRAQALTCNTEADCPEHFSCETVGTTACDSPKECPPGETCPTPSTCEPTEIKACKSPSCTSDRDCPANMVCFAETGLLCAASVAGGVDGGARDAGCREVEVGARSCTPRYVPPCTKAADCGDGFTCEEVVSVSCSGSGAGGAGAPDAREAPADQCTSTRTGVFRCQLQEMSCESASSCPSGFSCAANPSRAVCKSVGQAVPADEDGGTPVVSACPDAGGPAKVCLPPYYDLAFASSGETAKSSGSSTAADAGYATGGGTNGVYNIHRGFWGHGRGCDCSIGAGAGSAEGALGQLGFAGLALFGLLARRRR